MKFEEEKAKQIVKDFGLSEKTIAVWRVRGAIPDKYGSGKAVKKEPLSKADKIISDRIINVFNSGFLYVTVFNELTGANITDIIRSKSSFRNREEFSKAVKEIKRLKIDLTKILDNNKLKNKSKRFLTQIKDDTRIKHHLIYKTSMTEKEIKQAIDFLRFSGVEEGVIDDSTINNAKDAIIKFILQLNID